jgi:hypothetical protein
MSFADLITKPPAPKPFYVKIINPKAVPTL